VDSKILEVDLVEKNSCIARGGGGEPPALSEYGKKSVML